MSLAADALVVARRLWSSPGYTSAIVLTLALVLGANTAIFSALHATVLNPIAARDPDRLVVSWENDTSRSLPVVELPYKMFQEWATHSRSFSQAAAFGSSVWTSVLREVDEPVRLSSMAVTATFFDTLGVRPMLGRAFEPRDDVPNAERVVILSHRLWATLFGANPAVVGTTIHFDKPHVIVGVMPPEFDFPRGADYWTPVVPRLAESSAKWKMDALSNVGVLFVLGRLRDGVSADAAAAELDTLAARLQREGGRRFGTGVTVTPLVDFLLGPVRHALLALFAAVIILLVIACANVSGLIMRRASLRRREFAIRLGLGATLSHLSRLWLVETAMLAAAGGVMGIVAAYWINRAIVTLAPQAVPRLADSSINVPVVAFTLLAVLATAFVCGAWPIRDLRSLDLTSAVKDAPRGTTGRSSQHMRSALVTLQICLAVVLLVAGGLVIRSVINVGRINLGFAPSGVITTQVSSRPGTRAVNEWFNEVIARAASVPGVQAAGTISQPPFKLGVIGADSWVVLEGQADTAESRRQNPTVNAQIASPGYFAAMRIPLKQGRLFNEQDDARAPRVALVSETTARRLWPGQDPIQRRILLPSRLPGGPPSAWRIVVGVVGDVRYRGVDDVRLDVYDAALQSAVAADNLVVRASGDLVSIATAVRAEVRRLDSRAVLDRVSTMEDVVAQATAPWRFSVWVFTVFAVVACVLAAVGLFGLVALDVARRRHEFALRLAIGAQPSELVRLALVSAGVSVVLGVTCGLFVSVVGTRVIQGMLFQVSPLDATTYIGVVALVVTVVSVASYLPARRAMKVDPLELLRAE